MRSVRDGDFLEGGESCRFGCFDGMSVLGSLSMFVCLLCDGVLTHVHVYRSELTSTLHCCPDTPPYAHRLPPNPG